MPCSVSPWHLAHRSVYSVSPRSACSRVYTPSQTVICWAANTAKAAAVNQASTCSAEFYPVIGLNADSTNPPKGGLYVESGFNRIDSPLHPDRIPVVTRSTLALAVPIVVLWLSLTGSAQRGQF